MMIRTDRRRFPILIAAIAALAVAMALLFSPVQAQEGSAPDKPTGLSATASHDSVTLNWDDPGDDSITGYVILRRNIVEQDPGEFTTVAADTGTADMTYTDDGVEPETRYAYRIKAVNAHGTSPRSGYVNIETPAVPTPEPTPEEADEPPPPPTSLSATASHDQVTLTWDDPQDDSITGYVILRRVRVNDEGGEFNELVADTGSATTTYTDGTVAASTTYTYRIKAINEHGASHRSRWYHIDIPAPPEPASNNPATGSPAITGTAQVGETLTVDTSGIADEDGLENATFSYQWLMDGTAISEATASTYRPVGADEGKAIKVRVSFTDDAGNDETLTSAATDAVAAAQPTEPPAKPAGLSATAYHDQVVLTWNDPNDDSITGYVILRRHREDDPKGEFRELVRDTKSAATTYTDDTVAAETPLHLPDQGYQRGRDQRTVTLGACRYACRSHGGASGHAASGAEGVEQRDDLSRRGRPELDFTSLEASQR